MTMGGVTSTIDVKPADAYMDDVMIDAVIADDPERVRRILGPDVQQSVQNWMPPDAHIDRTIKAECRLEDSPYSPDNPWCLAAVYDARDVLNFLKEIPSMIPQTNVHGNNILHCLIANASICEEQFEARAVSTAEFIRDLVGQEDYGKLLLSENNDGLRPLELAAHLGTFLLFDFFLNTPEVYITRTEQYRWYTILYYDVTDYMAPSRFLRSPPLLMMYLDREKLSYKSVADIYLSQPMASWFRAITATNMIYIILGAIYRCVFIALLFYYVIITFLQEVEAEIDDEYFDSLIIDNQTTLMPEVEYGTDDAIQASERIDSAIGLLLITCSCIALTWDVLMLIRKIIFQPKWLHQNVNGRKSVVVSYTFYRVMHCITLIFVTVVTGARYLYFSSDKLEYLVVVNVVISVWDVLYFLQLVPIFDTYVIAVQKMMKDFANFSLLFILFYTPYVLGFAALKFEDFDFYRAFQVILNMETFTDVSASVSILHVCFVFMVAVLLLTYIIAMLSSTYEKVRQNRSILTILQRLSVILVAEEHFSRLLWPLHNWLRKRCMIHDGGRYFVTKVVQIQTPNKSVLNHNQSAPSDSDYSYRDGKLMLRCNFIST